MRSFWRELRRRKLGMAGVIRAADRHGRRTPAPVLATSPPKKLAVQARLSPPGGSHYFGTDHLGRDVFSRVLYGGRTSLWVGGLVALASALFGLLLGLTSGYFPRLDTILMRVMDGMMAFPAILLALAILAATGPSTFNVVIALTLVYSAAHRAGCAGGGAHGPASGVCDGHRGARRDDRPYPRASHLAQCVRAGARADQHHVCLRDPGRGRSELPRRRRLAG